MMRHRKKHAGAPPRSFDDDEDSIPGEDRCKLMFIICMVLQLKGIQVVYFSISS